MTAGEIRLLIRKLKVGADVDLEVLSSFLSNRYARILDKLPWRRLDTETIIQSPASYAVGTVNVTQGSAVVTGVGTTFTVNMNGLVFRANTSADSNASSGAEYYQVAYVSATQLALDRPYENVTVAGAGYRIDQNFFLLPPSSRIVRGIRPLHDRTRVLKIITPAELSRIAPLRAAYGTPEYAAVSWDNQSDPPIQQIEFYPIPTSPDSGGITLAWAVEYTYDPALLSDGSSSSTLLPWARPDALIAGVALDCALDKGDQVRAELYKAEWNERIAEMAGVDAESRPYQPLRLARQYQGNRPSRWRRGPHHEGFTG